MKATLNLSHEKLLVYGGVFSTQRQRTFQAVSVFQFKISEVRSYTETKTKPNTHNAPVIASELGIHSEKNYNQIN